MPEEVDTWPLIARAWRRRKRIFVPLTVRGRILTFREVTPDSDLSPNEWGLLEPVAGAELPLAGPSRAASGERVLALHHVGLAGDAAGLPPGEPVHVATAHVAPRREVAHVEGAQQHPAPVQARLGR